MNELMNLTFQGRQIRMVIRDGEPWWIAADVCEALGIDRSQTRRLDDDERGVCSVQTPGGVQEMVAVNEPGLYSLIMGARNREGEAGERIRAFKRWVTHDVLPSIRKTGTYIAPGAAPSQAQVALALAQALVEHERRLNEVAARVAAIEARQQEAEQQLQALPEPTAPPADITKRALLNRLIRAYAIETGVPVNVLWNRLYLEFRDRYHVDLKARATHRKAPLDVAEELGHIETLYNLACHLFKRAS